jgi:hypothetical protein
MVSVNNAMIMHNGSELTSETLPNSHTRIIASVKGYDMREWSKCIWQKPHTYEHVSNSTLLLVDNKL